jgi:hypothetical protein
VLKFWWDKLKDKNQLEKYRGRSEINIKMHVKEIIWGILE